MKKEYTLVNNFTCLSSNELTIINGGGWDAAFVAAGTLAVSWAPVIAFIPVIGPVGAGAIALAGVAAIVVGSNSDFDLIKY